MANQFVHSHTPELPLESRSLYKNSFAFLTRENYTLNCNYLPHVILISVDDFRLQTKKNVYRPADATSVCVPMEIKGCLWRESTWFLWQYSQDRSSAENPYGSLQHTA